MRGANGHSGGFTLIEVLIALAITALIATLSFSSLTAVLDSVEQLRETRGRITEMNRFWSLFGRDINSVVPRAVRNEYGDSEAAFRGGAGVESFLQFTRLGWHNPNRHYRSNMQRVHYVLEDETLWRESFPVLDRSSDTESRRVALLEDVLSFEMRFLSPKTQVSLQAVDTDDWEETWPATADNAGHDMPAALEIRMEVEGWGEIRRLYDIPGN